MYFMCCHVLVKAPSLEKGESCGENCRWLNHTGTPERDFKSFLCTLLELNTKSKCPGLDLLCIEEVARKLHQFKLT